MKVTLLGYKTVDFENERGETIEGINLFIAYPEENTVGSAAEKKFINSQIFDGFGVSSKQLEKAIGCVIDVEYGPRNKIVGLSIL
ncbi:MAG: hypothetical protein NC084_00080 [Bacteroides sp.]|nr:hypothetical protein [Eubacterium sp.]MCM1417296.1 hypothetical protein [Roseburia sp.]MCM1461084.1 hypothetical protein [Bacteroides sp.]